MDNMNGLKKTGRQKLGEMGHDWLVRPVELVIVFGFSIIQEIATKPALNAVEGSTMNTKIKTA